MSEEAKDCAINWLISCAPQVPCIAVVENMAYFDGAGQRYYPFGQGSGARICSEFGLPNLTRMPIIPELSAAGDGAVWRVA